MAYGHLEGVVAGERRAAGEAAVRDGAERVHVGGTRDGPAGGLLRRHVEGSAGHRVRAGDARDVGRAGHPEVDQDHGAVVLHEQVARLHVPVDDAPVVRRVQRLRHLGHDRHRLGDLELPGGFDPPRQRLTGDELHHQVVGPAAAGQVVLTAVEDLDHAGVAQRGHDPGLGTESGDEVGVGHQGGKQHLHRDRTTEDQVGGTPDVAHAAGGDTVIQAVPTAEYDV